MPHLNVHDHKRFSKGLARVFIDNYAAIPSESIRRLLALREAGIIHILALGEDYEMETNETHTVLKTADNSYSFDVLLMPAVNVHSKYKIFLSLGCANSCRKQARKSLMLVKIIRYSSLKNYGGAWHSARYPG